MLSCFRENALLYGVNMPHSHIPEYLVDQHLQLLALNCQSSNDCFVQQFALEIAALAPRHTRGVNPLLIARSRAHAQPYMLPDALDALRHIQSLVEKYLHGKHPMYRSLADIHTRMISVYIHANYAARKIAIAEIGRIKRMQPT